MTGAVPVLETARLRLRGWRDDDVDAYAAICGDPEVMRWLGAAGTPLTPAESAEQLAGFRRHWDDHGFGLWCVTAKPDDTCLGFVGLAVPRFLPEILPAIEIGWRLARAAWGQGYATEAARAVVAYAFGTAGLDRIVSVTRPPNRGSWNIMGKLGMTLERTTTHPAHGYEVIVYELVAPAVAP